MASSMEQLVRYANCRGSRVGGRRFFMWIRISLSKHFMMVEVSAIGWWSLRQNTGDFLSTGIMVVVLKLDGTVVLLRELTLHSLSHLSRGQM